MKKFGLLAFLFFIIAFFSQLQASAPLSIECVRAVPEDIDNLMELYAGFTADDYHKVLVFPPELHRQKVEAAIAAGRFFVAKDPAKEGNNIVAFLKLYLVKEAEEKIAIAGEELSACATPAATTFVPELLVAESYDFTQALADNYAIRPVKKTAVPEYSFSSEDVYVYYGGAYTLKEYRNHGVNTTLENAALALLYDEVFEAVFNSSGHHLYYMYGVVEANFGGFARLRAFSKFTRSLLKDLYSDRHIKDDTELELSFNAFRAYKPTFEMCGGDLVVSKPEAGKGYGCFVGCKIGD